MQKIFLTVQRKLEQLKYWGIVGYWLVLFFFFFYKFSQSLRYYMDFLTVYGGMSSPDMFQAPAFVFFSRMFIDQFSYHQCSYKPSFAFICLNFQYIRPALVTLH